MIATAADLKSQIKDINTTGKEHLKNIHCIDLEEDATTHRIINAIAQIPPLKYAVSISGFMSKAQLPENTEYILHLPSCIDFTGAFSNVINLTKLTFTGLNDFAQFRLSGAFMGCKQLEEVDFGIELLYTTTLNSAFTNCHNLKRVRGVLSPYECEDKAINFMFAYELEEIRFDVEVITVKMSFRDSSKLSVQSVQSIVDGLAEVDTQLTLTLNSAVSLTDEQKATINDKGWTLVLYNK